MTQQDIFQHLKPAIVSSILAGKEILEVYNSDNFEVQIKSDNSPLTLADNKANIVITYHLQKTGLPILSEEGRSIDFEERKKWEYFWMVDPLDGTKEFIKRNDEFTVNIALINKNTPIAGVIYIPVSDELYISEQYLGSYKISHASRLDFNNISFEEITTYGKKLPVQDHPSTFTIVGSRSHMSPETEELINKYKQEYGDVDMLSKGSSLKICMVAEGAAHVYPRFAPTMEWDTAAGHAIAQGAGLTITQKDGSTPLVYNKENLLNPWFIVK